MQMIKVTTDWLQSIEAIKDVPAAQLQWLIDNSDNRLFKQGEFLLEPGDPMNATYIVVEGHIRMYVLQNKEIREFVSFDPKDITGYLPFSRGKIANAYAEVMSDTQVLVFPATKVPLMISLHFELTQALVHILTNRVRNFTALQQQNEKMMALGKLSAGLAHELNNPASAIVRGAYSLKKHLQSVRKTFQDIVDIKINKEKVEMVNAMVNRMLNESEKPTLTMMERSDLEDDMTEWLDDHNISNAPDIAENFVDFGVSIEEADEFLQHLPEPFADSVMNWVNNSLVTEKMVRDMEEASRRIADLVGSVKNFTHMDQGHDKQYADIHDGIKNTLTMLIYKIHKGSIEMKKDFDRTLPPVKAMIGELNQVWTNLIDNALDAMEPAGKGVLEIKTKRDKEFVEVSIIDNGPGIPDSIRSQIFDPFFTTKPIGKGTGLGLDVVTRIVQQHRGSIKVNSVPGRTEFIVCFPIDG
jgi:signal transduction histidine kinase